MLWVIYKITNLLNQKAYVGITSVELRVRWNKHKADARQGSKFYFHRALRKYGSNVWKVNRLEKCNTLEAAKAREKVWVGYFNTANTRFGYNRTLGGDSSHTVEVRRKISLKKKGVPLTETHRKNISIATKGKPQSPELIAKRSAALKGRAITETQLAALLRCNAERVVTDETRAKQRAAKIGKSLSLEHVAAIKAAKAANPYKHSDEVKRKISETPRRKRKPMSDEEKEKRRQIMLKYHEQKRTITQNK